MGVAVSSSHIVSATPSSSGGGLFTLFSCSSVGSLPWDTVLHELLHRESFPWATVLHKLLQHGPLPWGAVLQEQTAPAWVPRGLTSPARSLIQSRLPMGSQPPLAIHLFWHGVLHGLQVDICSTINPHGLQEDSLPHHGPHHRL